MHPLDLILSIIAPHQCIGCGSDGSVVCQWCLPDICTFLPERCFLCKQLSDNSASCITCRKRYKLPSHVWVRSVYDGTAKQLVRCLKFNRKRAASKTVAYLLHESLPYLPANTIIVPITTATSRIRARGYDQAALVARDLGRITKLKYRKLLHRIGHDRQVGAKRNKRLHQLSEAFFVLPSNLDKRTPILLIDDITTTGGTVIAATTALKKAGFKRITAAVFAQKE